ncbi:Uncharacterized protein ImpA [Pseudomonas orientalis]|uniref:type VI secretion system protein TssA n=1 Tax=Pseudomonas orientalis TaxID=76758 RepID=UPI000F581D2D|nr:type VI secretion system protein TssA [Pseudomonas orientalis]AZE84298.1 Uncharacterized protein ImpA [Pseudomonas orientalis]
MVHSEKLCAYYQELARTPCSPGNFAGNDVRFSSEFEAVEAEVARTQSIHGARLPDWQQVCEISERLLREQSKDLRVAVWLTWALHQRDSFPGLLAGLVLLVYLCEHHWVQVYPTKPRTRVAALGWLVARLDPLFSQNLSLVDQLPTFRALHDHLVRLDELLNEYLGGDAPLLLPSRRQLAQRLARATQGEVEPAGIAGVVAQVRQASMRPLKPEPSINNEKDAHKALRALQEQGHTLCTWWLRQNATDLRALRLGRTLAWLSLVNYPDANSEGLTALRPLAPDKLKRYQDHLSQGHHAELLLELEASLAGALFWFDGLRMVWECLEALHASQAMTELEMSFALLLHRLPNLPELRFDDGTPFAAPATSEWIRLHVVGHLHKPESFNAVADVGSEPWEAALQAVMPSLRQDGLKTAVGVLKQGLQSACSERARFHWRLALARLCVLAGKPDLGRMQLEQLDLELQRAGLDRWEPELSLHVGRLLYRCYDLLPQSHAVRESKDATHRRLCQFDLEAVLE